MRCRGEIANERRDQKKHRSPTDLLRVLWIGATHRHETDMSFKDVLALFEAQGGLCYWTGAQMTAAAAPRHPTNVSIDRIDSARGYVRGNVALCCLAVNYAKRDLSAAEFIRMCRKVAKLHG
jgi:hypothetical protein